MPDYVRGACCRRLFHWREESLEMRDLHSTAPNAFALLQSCISSVFSIFFSPSSFFHLMLSRPAATHSVHPDLSRATTLGAARPDFLLLLAVFQCHLSSQFFRFLLYCPACSMCVGVGANKAVFEVCVFKMKTHPQNPAVLLKCWGKKTLWDSNITASVSLQNKRSCV